MATKINLHKPISNRDKITESAIVSEETKKSNIKSFAEFVNAATTNVKTGKNILKNDALTKQADLLLNASAGTYPTQKILEVVIGDDDRVAVKNTLDSPWKKIASLRIKSKTGKTFVGTGWFIGPKVLATAGHCVFMHKEGGWAENIEVSPAMNGSAKPFGTFVSKQFFSVEGWVKDRNSDTDYAVIILDKPVGNETGWFGFANLEDDELKKQIANISGYPLDLEKATRQYYHSRKLTLVSSRKVYYDIDTFGGQSGSPVWLNLGENDRVAIAVHTTGGSTSNNGTRIIKEVFENFKNWKNL